MVTSLDSQLPMGPACRSAELRTMYGALAAVSATGVGSGIAGTAVGLAVAAGLADGRDDAVGIAVGVAVGFAVGAGVGGGAVGDAFTEGGIVLIARAIGACARPV